MYSIAGHAELLAFHADARLEGDLVVIHEEAESIEVPAAQPLGAGEQHQIRVELDVE